MHTLTFHVSGYCCRCSQRSCHRQTQLAASCNGNLAWNLPRVRKRKGHELEKRRVLARNFRFFALEKKLLITIRSLKQEKVHFWAFIIAFIVLTKNCFDKQGGSTARISFTVAEGKELCVSDLNKLTLGVEGGEGLGNGDCVEGDGSTIILIATSQGGGFRAGYSFTQGKLWLWNMIVRGCLNCVVVSI